MTTEKAIERLSTYCCDVCEWNAKKGCKTKRKCPGENCPSHQYCDDYNVMMTAIHALKGDADGNT